MPNKVIRVVDASIDETIEIHWWKRKDQATEILRIRYSAPPPSSWDEKLRKQQEKPADE